MHLSGLLMFILFVEKIVEGESIIQWLSQLLIFLALSFLICEEEMIKDFLNKGSMRIKGNDVCKVLGTKPS